LKGLRVGDAQVSPLHANFIVNLGGALASDIDRLIAMVREQVLEAHRITLQPEVMRLGFGPGSQWDLP
ncbi:MAG: hypothetical protein ACK6AD_11695, partial [Cyanobacteriota bacterium]